MKARHTHALLSLAQSLTRTHRNPIASQQDTQRNKGRKSSIPMHEDVTNRLVSAGEEASLIAERIWGANTVDGKTPPARDAEGKPREVPVLPSGAGHDAGTLASGTCVRVCVCSAPEHTSTP